MFANASFRQALREAAPRLSKRYFSCHSRPLNPDPYYQWRSSSRGLRFAKAFNTARTNLRGAFPVNLRALSSSPRAQGAIQPLQQQASSSSKESFFPEKSSRAVAYWLLASAASVFGIVVFGGLTRLTESGLSITEWKPVTGSLPPMSAADWESEFAKYRASPEFLVLNSRMTLDEFKSIYWMEWIHRVWGRFVGLSFVIPAVYFVARGRVSRRMAPKLAGIAGLIGFQGFLGWWMVKSGLKDDFLQPERKPGRDVPRVSQYRLAAHLGTAFVAYLSMLWCGLSILKTDALTKHKTHATSETNGKWLKNLLRRNAPIASFRLAVAALLGLTFTTAMSGALVAGLDAGLIYNEFPYMGLGLAPPMSELFDPFYSHDPSPAKNDLIWRNFLENPSLVQLDHRILATTTFTAVHALWAWTKMSEILKQNLSKTAKRGVHGVLGFVWLQVILGISTLIYMVPVPVASLHQAGALALMTWTTVLFSRVHVPKAAIEILRKRAGWSDAQFKDFVSSVASANGTKLASGHQSHGIQALQASLGTATAAAAGTIIFAGQIQDNKDAQKAQQRSGLTDEQVQFLQRQQHALTRLGPSFTCQRL